ncbi:hypothetical protein BFR78_008285 [Acinetobacter pittii]|nr:hypothetical protein [Acinetobacter pittii]MCK0877356.1 hypothetical protein [Acinetobacter pittii]
MTDQTASSGAVIPVTGEGPVTIHAEAVDAQGNLDVADDCRYLACRPDRCDHDS